MKHPILQTGILLTLAICLICETIQNAEWKRIALDSQRAAEASQKAAMESQSIAVDSQRICAEALTQRDEAIKEWGKEVSKHVVFNIPYHAIFTNALGEVLSSQP